jgi:ATP-dependent protease HslVU (ClpYQ) peptidase subunit
VTITGNGFSATAAENVVTLNSKSCPVTSASTTELKVTIPAEGGTGKMIVNVNGKSAETPEFTYILSPDEIPLVISGISPISGPKTTIVTITGSGFSTNAAENVVTLNGLSCPVIAAAPTELKVTIPAKAGSGKLLLNVYGKTGETPPFTYIYSQVTITTLAGSTQGDGDKFNTPRGVAVDKDGNVYVADQGNHKIKKITPSGVVSTFAGSTEGDGDKFNYSSGLDVDKDGNVYVADLSNNKIKKITPSGVVSTFAGSTQGDGDKFFLPSGVAVDKDGNVYAADLYNHKIKKITTAGEVSTYAGSAKGDGDKFYHPTGVDVDKDGNVYVADHSNHKIKKIALE